MQILAVLSEVEDGISYELAGTVERDIATPFDVEEFDTLRFERLQRRREVCLLKGPAQGHNWWMLHEQ